MGWGEDRDSSLKIMEVLVGKALKIDDKDPLALGHAGMLQLFLGNHDLSIAFAKQALAQAPGMDSPYYSLGWFQMFNDTPLEGIENIRRAMRLSPILTAPRTTILGTAYRNAGQLELAVATLENTVQQFPAFISGRVALTTCYVLMGKGWKQNKRRVKYCGETLPIPLLGTRRQICIETKKQDNGEMGRVPSQGGNTRLSDCI